VALWLVAVALPATVAAAPWTKQHGAVQKQIAAARRDDPSAFTALAAVKSRVPELDRKKRGRLAAVTPLLRALGPRALLPMLDEATRPETTLTGTARTAWRVGLLEAVGALRDPRATPVLRQLIAEESEVAVIRAAAGALGNLGDLEAVQALTALATTRGPKQLAVIAGMGECRRLPAARTLAGLLARRPGEELALALVKALGELGTAWAWETPRLAALAEGAAVRALAAGALLDAFVRYDRHVRDAAATGILLVDAPRTLELIGRARAGAPRALQAELDRLSRRVERSPLRPRTK
jgi:HEAT repeat protein